MDSPRNVLADRQRRRWPYRLMIGILALIAMLALASCGGSGGGSGPGNDVAVSVSPSTATVAPSGSTTFSATVTGTSDQRVTWSASAGSITTAGVFTAPASTGTVTITATSVADPTKSDTASVTVGAAGGVAVEINPKSVVVDKGGQVQFQATVTGSSNTGVTWEADAGTITQDGLFTAPNQIRNVQVRARSKADTTVFAAATVSVSDTGPVVTINPLGATLGTNETKQFTATVSNSGDQRVTWTATGGTITANGLYQAGHNPGTYTVTATSVADPTSHVSVNVTVRPITVTVTPNGASAVFGQQVQFHATVSGATNTNVTWSASAGTISANGLWTAPNTAQNVTITATSVADPTVTGTGTITVVQPSDTTYDFESGVPGVWVPTNRNETTPVGSRKFLGRMGGSDSATLTLSGLTSHQTLTVSFDLFVIGAWTGATDSSQFQVKLGSNTVFSQTFSNTTGNNQTYPDGGSNAPGTGSTERNSLGYTHDPAIKYNDTVYHISFTIDHTSSTATLQFLANLTGTLQDMSWGIDNVRVRANP